MPTDAHAYRFQAAVELPLSLAFQNSDGTVAERSFRVAVVAERVGLNEHEVVMDFRLLESALAASLESFNGHVLQDHGLAGLVAVAKMISEAMVPFIKPPARLACVSLTDGDGRKISLQP
jgi:hypothetical protein